MVEHMSCLRNASISALARAQDKGKLCAIYSQQDIPYLTEYPSSGLYNSFHSVLDGVLFKGYPTGLFQRGEFTHVPLIVGYVGVRC